MTWFEQFKKKEKKESSQTKIVIQASPSTNSMETMGAEMRDFNRLLQKNKQLKALCPNLGQLYFVRGPIANRNALEEIEQVILGSNDKIIQLIIDESQIGAQTNQKMDKLLTGVSKVCKENNKELQTLDVSATLPASVDLYGREIILKHTSLFYQPPPENYNFATDVGLGARYYDPIRVDEMIRDFALKVLNDGDPGYGMIFLNKAQNDEKVSDVKNKIELSIRESEKHEYELMSHTPTNASMQREMELKLRLPGKVHLIQLNCKTKKYVERFFTNKNSVDKKHFDKPVTSLIPDDSKVFFVVKDMFAESDRIDISNISAVLDIKARGSQGEQSAAQQVLGRFSGINKTQERPGFELFTDKEKMYKDIIRGFEVQEQIYSSENPLEIERALDEFQKSNLNLTSSTTKSRKVLYNDSVELSYVVIKQPGYIDLKDTDKVKRFIRDYLEKHGTRKELGDIAFKNYSDTQDNMNSEFFKNHFENYEVAKNSLRKYEPRGSQQTFLDLERHIVAPRSLMSVRSSQKSAIGKGVFCFSTQQKDGIVVYFLPEKIINEKFTTTQAVKETTACKVY